ncbi:uncharacterized protein [Miscanthus floridulus]|uniref:uncharacterized protein isoform X2 n=1 Tax=Miscanthus floridulus TaxID=154761 RepID=UPI003458CC83
MKRHGKKVVERRMPCKTAAAFTEQQLKQLRAQCLVFLSIRNNMVPTKKHLEIALGEFSAEGSSSHGGSGGGGDNRLDMSRLAGCRPPGGTTRRIVRRGPRKMQ